MLGIRSFPTNKLTALRFHDDDSFARAARVAATERIPVDAPGHLTLIVHLDHVPLFERESLKFEREKIRDPEQVPPKEYASLRKRLFGFLSK
jgi:hypothetical protein